MRMFTSLTLGIGSPAGPRSGRFVLKGTLRKARLPGPSTTLNLTFRRPLTEVRCKLTLFTRTNITGENVVNHHRMQLSDALIGIDLHPYGMNLNVLKMC